MRLGAIALRDPAGSDSTFEVTAAGPRGNRLTTRQVLILRTAVTAAGP